MFEVSDRYDTQTHGQQRPHRTPHTHNQTMDSINHPAKKRKAAPDSPDPPLPGNDDPRTALSLADLNRLIDHHVVDAVKRKTLALTLRVDDLQRENEALLLRCESLERSVQVLKEEGNWTYSAPDVLESHWIEQGHSEAYAFSASSVFRSIKNSAQRLRSAGGGYVDVLGTPQSPAHALYPHWKQLANAIQLSERITKLHLGNVQLDQRTLQMIEASVRQKGITNFILAGNQFLGDEGVRFAISVLKSNRSVAWFGWQRNHFHSTEEACSLVDAVLEHPTISGVSFIRTFNEGTTPYTPVKSLFGGAGTDTLLRVNLSFNVIKTNGDRSIPDFLSSNPPLRLLDLEGNRLTDDDALHIALALQSNTNLRELHLEDNALTATGKDVVYYQAIYGLNGSDPSESISLKEANLNTFSGANHTCQIDGICRPKMFMNRSIVSAKLNRAQKLFILLRKRHREGCSITQLESEFSEDSMGLVPHVLSCINAYSTGFSKRHCLSLLFELARDWKTPEIYQLHRD